MAGIFIPAALPYDFPIILGTNGCVSTCSQHHLLATPARGSNSIESHSPCAARRLTTKAHHTVAFAVDLHEL